MIANSIDPQSLPHDLMPVSIVCKTHWITARMIAFWASVDQGLLVYMYMAQ